MTVSEARTSVSVPQASRDLDILAVIEQFSHGAFTGWIGKTGNSKITLDHAEDHFSLCMADMMDAVRECIKRHDAA